MEFTTDSKINSYLKDLGVISDRVYHNLPPSELEEISIEKGMAQRSSLGAIAIDTGKFTGRSPKDRFIVEDDITRDSVWWGDVNRKFSASKFDTLLSRMVDYLHHKQIYIRDAYACADDRYRLNIRVLADYPWSDLFVYNMFLRPSADELDGFSPEWTVIDAPGFMANPEIDGTRQENFAVLNFTKKIILIGGTGYTGEMKKGIFSALNFILPFQKNVLSMHCSANVGKEGDTAIFFGLSGTGKTTLSADPNRKLIGDDEHGWTPDNVIFNFEGGCYAKVINLSPKSEPEIFGAIKEGALLENVVLSGNNQEIEFDNATKTENTRVSYPIHHIENIQKPSLAGNPKNIFFLTCDAYGVLPPISKLTPGQAAFHFISGYTAKVAGTEAGVTEPEATFSACFGSPFMPLHPTFYGKMLSAKIEEAGVHVWLVNTGWTGGPYGVGSRMKLKYTRAMINAAFSGDLNGVPFVKHPVFKLAVPVSCAHVPDELLNPKTTWTNKEAYDLQAKELAKSFNQNFEQFMENASLEMIEAMPNEE